MSVSNHSKKIIKEQGNVKAFELLELTNEVLCSHCHRCMTTGRVCCYCGRTLVFANPNSVVEEQTVRITYDTCLAAFLKGPKTGRPHSTFAQQT